MGAGSIKQSGKVFRDPIHTLIRIDPADQFILELIDSPVFQRLRRVRQLGVSSLTFHGAEHTRFVHSMGVFNFAQRIVDSLIRRYGRDSKVGQYLETNSRVIKAAALLHDIGHGPFSHMLERALRGSAKHEKMTSHLITSEESRIGSVLKEAGIDSLVVADIIDKVSPHKLLTDIVSSQIDADRIDYLLRDSYCTGVEYGQFDSEWLLNALSVGRDPSSSSDGHHQWRLCLDEERGLQSAEQFVLARAHMSEQVYFHRVTRGYEALLLNLFECARKAAKEERLPDATPFSVKAYLEGDGLLDLKYWLQFDEATMVSAFHTWAMDDGQEDHQLSRLSNAFLRRERVFAGVRIDEVDLIELFKSLQSAGLEENVDWRIDKGDFTVYKGLLAGSSGSKDQEEQSNESILLGSDNPDQRARPCEAESGLFRSLDGVKRRVMRLYYDKAKATRFDPILSKFKLKKG